MGCHLYEVFLRIRSTRVICARYVFFKWSLKEKQEKENTFTLTWNLALYYAYYMNKAFKVNSVISLKRVIRLHIHVVHPVARIPHDWAIAISCSPD